MSILCARFLHKQKYRLQKGINACKRVFSIIKNPLFFLSIKMYPEGNSSASPLFLSDNASEEALHFHRKRKPCIIFTSFLPKFPANLPFCWENFLHIFSKKFQQEKSFLLGPLLISVSVEMRDQGARCTVQNVYSRETGWRHYRVALSASNGRKKKMYCRPCKPRKYRDILLVIFYLLENCFNLSLSSSRC